jgi:predicted NUDIX family phosphoesterase
VTDEQVYVIPRADALRDGPWHGIRVTDHRAFATLADRHGRFAPRVAMEQDPSFKQVIPYLVLRDGPRWFLMQRTRAGVDTRLHDRWSIGVGGHLNPGDAGIEGGLLREWHEELDASFVPTFRFVGVLNDDTTPVGSVHLGVVFSADAGGRPVAVRETDKLTGGFVTDQDVAAVAGRLETWSAIVFDHLTRTEGVQSAAVR